MACMDLVSISKEKIMNITIRNDILYIYRNEELMLSAYTGLYGGHAMMYSADYALQVDRSTEFDYCKVIKDRSGVLDKNATLPLKKVLKIIRILQDETNEG